MVWFKFAQSSACALSTYVKSTHLLVTVDESPLHLLDDEILLFAIGLQVNLGIVEGRVKALKGAFVAMLAKPHRGVKLPQDRNFGGGEQHLEQLAESRIFRQNLTP